MNAKGFAQWEKLKEEFLNSDLAEDEFCQSRSLSLKWFRKQRREAENYKWRIEPEEPNTAKNLFVELVTEPEPATEQLETLKVMLSVRDNELLTKAPITKLVTQLIDLDYLARISPMKVAPVKAPKVPKAPKTK